MLRASESFSSKTNSNNSMDVMDYLNKAEVSLFRYEGLQTYQGDDFDNLEESMKEWWNFVEAKTKSGVKMQRVRLVLEPLTPYVQKELEVHKRSISYGDDIRVTNEADKVQDFWLIDDSTVLLMNYNKEGLYLGFEAIMNDGRYVAIKEKLLTSSKPLITIN